MNNSIAEKKLDKWAELLLDTGKRNNLINFKDSKTSSVEVIFPSAEELFEKIDNSVDLEVFDPDNSEEDDFDADFDKENSFIGKTETQKGKSAYLDKYVDKLKKKSQILLYNSSKNSITVLKNIDKRAKSFIEETGVNVAYMAFGFIHWKEKSTSDFVFNAPVLLVPIQLNQDSMLDPYYISSTGDDFVVNPTFSYKLEAEQGVKLPDYQDEGLKSYLQKVEKIVKPLKWTVSSECKIGIFSFMKINMYRDLKNNNKKIISNKNVRILLGEPIDTFNNNENEETRLHVDNPLIELHSVVDADSSQIEAIEMAKSGKSFVLQGPPGTGKSQTITNIIAECLSDGKKVLFVSEKRAALNVVYEKLRNAGLSEFCLELHSHKANKKDVISDICHSLRSAKSTVLRKADEEIASKKKTQRQLDEYAFELHKQQPKIGESLYQLYESFASLRSVPDVDWTVPQLESKGEMYLNEGSLLLEQYVDYIPSVGYDYRKNPWYGYINQDISYQSKTKVKTSLSSVVQLLQVLIPVLQEISQKYGINCKSIEDAAAWKAFFRFISDSKLITPYLLSRENFAAINSILNSLKSQSEDILSVRNILDNVFDEDVYKLDGSLIHKELTKQFNGAFSRLFDSEYKNLIKELKLCKKDGKKPSYAEALPLVERLAYYQQKIAEYKQTESQIIGSLGSAYRGVKTDWDYVNQQMKTLQEMFSKLESFGNITTYSNFNSEKNAFSDYANRIDDAFNTCPPDFISHIAGCFDNSILNIYVADCSLVLSRFNYCISELDRLDNWCHFRSLLSDLDDKQLVSYINTAVRQNIEPKYIVNAFKKRLYFEWIESVLSASPVLSAFNRISQDKAVNIFKEKDLEQFEINKAKIRSVLSAQRPSLDMIASGSALSILLREGEKKRKQKSIRSLLNETGELIQRIKPCFLMSPLSVSTFLDADSVHFDVVIFDEASQIFPQDAIGAIYRGNQLIVVGDSKQMPPSNFFNASVEAEDNDEETGDVTDFESVLDLCSASMQQLRLRWHYRSRYEQLVLFSNKNFYDNDLITFPSSKTDAPGIGVDYFHVDGVFDRKSHTNFKEAEYIVDLVYKNIDKYPNRSLGVVAFSVAQQDLIDKLLSKRRQNTPEKEFFFKNKDEEPFFVKNLETVQGDERDTIIFSVAYGIDAQGRLLHNFGPLNRAGGERRLNVAVTRAKYNVQLVSSMHYTDIDLNRTSAEGAKLLREYLDFAENGDIALERTVNVNRFEQFDSDFEIEVCDFLRSNGFSVDPQVGCSGFRIDLGLKMPNSSNYVLAIECDGATYHSMKNARDRDRLRQEILERMGWKFYRIWSTDWFRNKSVEKERLLEVATKAINNEVIVEKAKDNTPADSFEEVVSDKNFEFPAYKQADIYNLSYKYLPNDFKGMIKAILEVEAPISEEFLLKRIVGCFGREKVTNVVQRAYEQQMNGYQRFGIIRKNGFLYLNNNKEFKLRVPGDLTREIKYIAPEELAAGMLEILKQNLTVDKNGLYHVLASHCGFNRVGNAMSNYFDSVLHSIDNYISIDYDDVISLKKV